MKRGKMHPAPCKFLSPPSARRATASFATGSAINLISIPALREEGDMLKCWNSRSRPNFYPRPPRGGRLLIGGNTMEAMLFLSPPSARRATGRRGGGCKCQGISIPALREEGDNGDLRR